MTILYDAVDLAAIPDTAELVGAYVNGRWPTFTAALARFGPARVVSITVNAFAAARVLDVEKRDATPAQAPQWAVHSAEAGSRPTIYCSRSSWPAVRAAFQAAGVPEPDYWIADWTGVPHLVPGAVATQYANPPTSGGDFDLTLTDGIWPASPQEAPPVTTPAPPAPAVDACSAPNGGTWTLHADGGVFTAGGAPYLGSYPGLPDADKVGGPRTFVAIEARGQGYRIISAAGEPYDFPAT